MVELARRSFITGLITLVAAPAIVRAGSLMPVKHMVWSSDDIAQLLDKRLDVFTEAMPIPNCYVRYDGYETINFDHATYAWTRTEHVNAAMDRRYGPRLNG